MNANTPSSLKKAIPFAELVAIIASVMALNALAIDIMLPALGVIGEELRATHDNDRQLIIVVYVISNGFAQLLFGPIVDRFGRKTVLMIALTGYFLWSFLSVIAPTFAFLIAARAFQGFMTAAARVATVAMVRDQCAGRTMAKVMSLAITIFMAAPILAPAIGQIVLAFAPWRGIFLVLLIYGLLLSVWLSLRVRETLRPEDQKPLRVGDILARYGEFMTNKIAIGYTLAAALGFGAIFGYISASEQIFLEKFDLGQNFAVAFGATALALGVATFANANLVSKYGMRLISHSALVLFIVCNMLHLLAIWFFGESFVLFMAFMGISFFALGLLGPNMNAMAMEPMGHMAGAAAAANGFAGTTLAGFLGGIIGRFYNGSVAPIILGFLLSGLCALFIVLWTENGRLFRPSSQGSAT